MAKREVFDCDTCGERDIEERVIVPVDVGRVTGGPSGCPEGDPVNVMLCAGCAGLALEALVIKLPMGERRAWAMRHQVAGDRG